MSERRFTVDHSADAAYFPIATSIGAGESVENLIIERPHGTLVLDFDAGGRLLGLEVLGAKALLTAETIRDAEVLA
ncbi:DUF2283 domain-containing protein [Microbacterium sp. CFH 90308]|uniref:DUF2283 domain-containing protein n=1 Tax=Microbacterium salsuginis TaxID=2722803 RepID=A0ABX1K8J2_9MICO|nr:DUF2283 domain-containing protein [Microbacterium sp. CFH 90308]NLP83342.1 DUF2283 domain-containing protein [Microbacterium sp. CFH 90308]